MDVLSVKKLYKKYPKSKPFVLNDISFTVKQGELVALVGESGCGKTTLLRSISGLVQPQTGVIQIHDTVVFDKKTFLPPEKRKVGLVFQDYALFPHMTVSQNVGYGIGKHIQNKKSTINKYLELVGLENYASRYPHELSGGQQQRVALARSLAPQPSILLLDEPFSNLDELLKEHVRDEIRQIIKNSNTTAIFVTHDTHDALATADKIAILKQGKMMQLDTPQQLYEKPTNLYVGRFFGHLNLIGDQQYIRPENIDISTQNISDKRAVVRSLAFYGSFQKVYITFEGKELIVHANIREHFSVGQSVYIRFDETYIIRTLS